MGKAQRMILTFEAIPSAVPEARHAVAEFAAAAGATGDELDAIRLAASEALTNAVVHAYRGGSGPVHVSAALAEGELWVLVGDDGDGLSAGSPSSGLGVGLALIAELTDSFAVVNRSTGGTEVRMRFTLERARRPRGGSGGQGVRRSASSAAWPAASIFSTTR